MKKYYYVKNEVYDLCEAQINTSRVKSKNRRTFYKNS